MIQQVKRILGLIPSVKPAEISFIFPYSTDKAIKRQEIWSNLQKGLLLEDTGTFVPWITPYAELDKYVEQRKDSGDRTNWFLGHHIILDGINCNIGVMKWLHIKDKTPFSRVEEFLGFDNAGNQKFLLLRDRLSDTLGAPSLIELEKFGNNDLGNIQWRNGKIEVSLVGIEQFACKYFFHIGVTTDEIV